MAKCKDCIHEKVCNALCPKGLLPYQSEDYPAERFCLSFQNKADMVEVRRGEWAWYPDRMDRQELLCTNCEEPIPYNEDGERMMTPYCPNCGVKMGGGIRNEL